MYATGVKMNILYWWL